VNRGLHWISFDRPHGGDSDMASSCISSAPAMYQPAGKGEAERVEVAMRKKYSRNLLLHWAHVQGDCRTLSVLFLPVQGPFRQLYCLYVDASARIQALAAWDLTEVDCVDLSGPLRAKSPRKLCNKP
jgi:hypothetical protein